ncbi:MAG: hypothetical protein WKF65_00130 [Gaiellaceae bacterium]
MGTEEERRATLAAGAETLLPLGTRAAEQRVEFVNPRFQPDQLGATPDEKVSAEAITAVHLKRQTTEVTQPLLAHAHERPPLAAQLAWRGCGPSAPWRAGLAGLGRGCRRRGRVRIGLPQQAGEQR